MENYDYWESFARTGKIDDYLHYIACTREDSSSGSYGLSHKDGVKNNVEDTMKSLDNDKEGGTVAGI